MDIGKIDSLKSIVDEGDSVLIGAMVPYFQILADPSVQTGLGLLHKAISEVGDPQIRHRGTLGGALVHADPAGDCGATILALDAELVVSGQGGERTVAAADFFEDLFQTAVGEDELLTAIRVPKLDGWGSHFEKFVRVAHQWPIVAVAAAVKVEEARSARPGSGWSTWARPPYGPAPPSRHSSVKRPPRTAYGRRATRPPTEPTRPRTSTVTRTTAGISRKC